ncbi:hypothetical protein U1Q18_049876, partial [Sarracenia purpurea var. burkii]
EKHTQDDGTTAQQPYRHTQRAREKDGEMVAEGTLYDYNEATRRTGVEGSIRGWLKRRTRLPHPVSRRPRFETVFITIEGRTRTCRWSRQSGEGVVVLGKKTATAATTASTKRDEEEKVPAFFTVDSFWWYFRLTPIYSYNKGRRDLLHFVSRPFIS